MMQELGVHERKILAAMMRARDEGRLEIPVVSEQAAHALRMRTYAILKKVRGKFSSRPEWEAQYQGLGEVMIQIEKGAKPKVVFLRKDQTEYMKALTEALGGEEAIPRDPDEVEAEASAKRMAERLQQEGLIPGKPVESTPSGPGSFSFEADPPSGYQPNPYYKR